VTLTLVGEVPQGALSTALPGKFAIVSSQVPQEGLVSTDLGYPAVDGDTIYQWDGGGYVISSFLELLGGWTPEPTIGVGEAFWSRKSADGSWDRDFSVNQ
jgi:hypothetical protein